MRVQLELPEETVQNLKALMEKTGSETYKELFNNALTLLDWSVKQVEDGRIIASVNEHDQKYKELAMPVLQRVAYRSQQERSQQEQQQLVGAGVS